MIRKILIISILLFSFLLISAVEPAIEDINSEAVQDYQNKDYQSALEKFLQIEQQGILDANLFYNIGNCYFRLEQLGKSILYYKRTLKVNPAHSLAKKNLEFAFTLTRDKIETAETGALQKMIERIYHSFTLNSLAIISIILFAILVALLIILQTFYRFRDKSLPVFFIFLVIILLATSIIISSMKYSAYYDNSDAVILAQTAVGFSGPGSEYTRVFTIHEGMTCSIEDKNEDWVLIKLPNGIGGWVESRLLEKISL